MFLFCKCCTKSRMLQFFFHSFRSLLPFGAASFSRLPLFELTFSWSPVVIECLQLSVEPVGIIHLFRIEFNFELIDVRMDADYLSVFIVFILKFSCAEECPYTSSAVANTFLMMDQFGRKKCNQTNALKN